MLQLCPEAETDPTVEAKAVSQQAKQPPSHFIKHAVAVQKLRDAVGWTGTVSLKRWSTVLRWVVMFKSLISGKYKHQNPAPGSLTPVSAVETGEKITPGEAIRRLNDEVEKATTFLRKDQINAHHVQSEINRLVKLLTRTKKKNRGPEHFKGARFADSEQLDLFPMVQKPASYRKQLLAKGGCHCAYCDCKLSEKRATIDHIQPLSRGGENTPDNMILACQRCNQLKGSRTVIEWAADILAVHK